MKKAIQLLLLVVLFQLNSFSQSCLPNGLVISTQVEIDNFQINYPNCTEIEGDLFIEGVDIINLNGLNVLTNVGGLFEIDSTSLTNLSGLNSLTTVGGLFTIKSNLYLTSLTGLDNLSNLGGGIRIFRNYILPNLSGLENLTHIDGSLYIEWLNENLTSLAGLDNLVSIDGELRIVHVYSLTSLTSLANLTSVGSLYLGFNHILTNLSGLESLTTIEGNMHFYYNYELEDISSLSNINVIGGSLFINTNPMLISLTGLQNLTSIGAYLDLSALNITNLSPLNQLTSIGGGLYISSCWYLDSFSGFGNLQQIGGSLELDYNSSITSLEGLENIDPESIESIVITDNQNLATCEVQSVCDYLANSANSTIEISNNSSGCNSKSEVLQTCEATFYCLQDGITITSQAEVDNFLSNYPICTSIRGDVIINGDDITSLAGLTNIQSIMGDLDILSNNLLSNVSGLSSLENIEGSLHIYSNPSLVNLSGLSNLVGVNGHIWVLNNLSLTSLVGLGNIDENTIDGLYISENSSLSICEVQSICNYLVGPSGYINISNNNFGCNSQEEVESACPGSSGSCLPGGVSFTTQEQIDNFILNYPDCNQIDGDVNITGSDIYQLTALDGLTSILGDLHISGNANIVNLEGLENITYITGDLCIGDTTRGGNPELESLSGLENLLFIGGDLTIQNNPSLSICDIQSVCRYLKNNGGLVLIKNNSLGCANETEILADCSTSFIDISIDSPFTIYPNPVDSRLYISNNSNLTISELFVYNQLGQIVLYFENIDNFIDVSTLNQGLYFMELSTVETTFRHKLIVR